MEKFKWTPGPWKTSLTDDTFVRSADNDVAVMIGDYSDDVTSLIMTANANLIAAAPDLYAATNWVDKIKGFTSCYEYVPISAVKDYEKFQITLTGVEISALIGARRRARGE